MSQRVQRELRKHAKAVSDSTVASVAPAINAALQNEQRTRQRVDECEQNIERLIDYTAKTEVLARDTANWRIRSSFTERLRWLLTGR